MGVFYEVGRRERRYSAREDAVTRRRSDGYGSSVRRPGADQIAGPHIEGIQYGTKSEAAHRPAAYCVVAILRRSTVCTPSIQRASKCRTAWEILASLDSFLVNKCM